MADTKAPRNPGSNRTYRPTPGAPAHRHQFSHAKHGSMVSRGHDAGPGARPDGAGNCLFSLCADKNAKCIICGADYIAPVRAKAPTEQGLFSEEVVRGSYNAARTSSR